MQNSRAPLLLPLPARRPPPPPEARIVWFLAGAATAIAALVMAGVLP